jgi:manganese/zinc/iron transport system permease protein
MWENSTIRTVALGAGLLGVVSGALGVFAVLRKQSLVGDAVSHAALPGVVMAYILTGSRSPLLLVLGAGLVGWLGMLLVSQIARNTRVPFDSALGIVLSVFFGAGVVLLTWLQHRSGSGKAGLEQYLFGQAATMSTTDVRTIAVLGAVALVIVAVFWKELKLLSFDPAFAASQGWPTPFLDVLLTTLLVVATVIGLQCVGVVLMSALLVAPAAAARQWTDRLSVMTTLAALFGGISGIAGTLISDRFSPLPTGPTIVLCASLIVGVSLLLAPRRGLIWRRQRIG